MSTGRVVGLDFGTKRVGIAIADPLRMFSQPVGTFSQSGAIEVLDGINNDEGLRHIVIGWPLEEDGTEGRATEQVQHYINRLKKKFPDAIIVRQDERYSSERAKQVIRLSGRPSLRKTGRERIDTAAAGIILQEYLEDTQSNSIQI